MREEEALIIFGLFMLFWLAVWYTVNVFYLLTLSKALNRVDESRREMAPGMVWLNLIPLFNLGWHIYTVIKLSDALAREFDVRQIAYQNKPGFVIGLVASILMCTSIIPYIGGLLWIGGVVCGIIYWVQVAEFSKQIAEPA